MAFAPVKNVNRYITEDDEKKNRRMGIGITYDNCVNRQLERRYKIMQERRLL